MVKENQCTRGYYLADGNYPTGPVLIKTMNWPQDDSSTYFSKSQESAQKDIKHAFRILQAQCKNVAWPCRVWALHDICRVMYACMTLHNMILPEQEIPYPKVYHHHKKTRSFQTTLILNCGNHLNHWYHIMWTWEMQRYTIVWWMILKFTIG